MWNELSERAREVLAIVYEAGLNQKVYTHIDSKMIPDDMWKITVLNFAVTAAYAVDGVSIEIE